MILTRLRLKDFRSYKEATFEFGPKTVAVGPNGAGKTNLLEAIYLLAILRSFRAQRDEEAIRRGLDAAYLSGSFEEDGEKTVIEVGIERHRKVAKKDGRVMRLAELIGTFPAVLFSPESIELVAGPPKLRRRFLDALLSQASRKYPRELLSYQKALRDRNALLERIKNGSGKAVELFFWDKQLIEHGEALRKSRLAAISSINEEIDGTYQSVSGRKTKLLIIPQFFELSHDVLKEALPRDLELTATTVGPHRDNFAFELGGASLAAYGSRGEWRTAIFSLKIAELSFLKKETGKAPILLLDDIFSELDSVRREHLLDSLGKGQVVVTSADTKLVHDRMLMDAKLIELPPHA